jgi:hypothetical protein
MGAQRENLEAQAGHPRVSEEWLASLHHADGEKLAFAKEASLSRTRHV